MGESGVGESVREERDGEGGVGEEEEGIDGERGEREGEGERENTLWPLK